MSSDEIQNLIDGVRMHGVDVLAYANTSADLSQYTNRITKEYLDYPIPRKADPKNWFIPETYKNIEIDQYVLNLCKSQAEIDRVKIELDLFKKHNLIDVLKCMKFIVDTLRENKIIWGVGRGSSVASYVLFLLGVHKIDSIKYNLPLEEFFKEKQDG
jgi:DNA polymerase III alpha subunit